MKSPPRRLKDRRDIGEVEFLIEKLAAARILSSCCAGQEVMLETNHGLKKRGEVGKDAPPRFRSGAA